MPRLQVYLPDDLYAEVKQRQLPASELLQSAVRTEVARLRAIEEVDVYLAELTAEVGPPSERDRSKAEALIRRLDHDRKSAAR